MNAYIKVSETSEDPVPDKTRIFSLDFKAEELAFVVALKDAKFLDSRLDIVAVALFPNENLLQGPPEKHFSSVEEFLGFFGGIAFTPTCAEQSSV